MGFRGEINESLWVDIVIGNKYRIGSFYKSRSDTECLINQWIISSYIV